MTEDDIYDASTDEDSSDTEKLDSAEEDTDDEIRRFKKRKVEKKETPHVGNNKTPIAIADKNGLESSSADVQHQSAHSPSKKSTADSAEGVPNLPNFFAGKHFYLYGTFSEAERKRLNKYITAFDGTTEPYICDTVTHVITRNKWEQSFGDALAENPNLNFVRPEWILDCGKNNSLTDESSYRFGK